MVRFSEKVKTQVPQYHRRRQLPVRQRRLQKVIQLLTWLPLDPSQLQVCLNYTF